MATTTTKEACAHLRSLVRQHKAAYKKMVRKLEDPEDATDRDLAPLYKIERELRQFQLAYDAVADLDEEAHFRVITGKR